MTPKDVRRSDRYTHLAVAAATQAAEEANVPDGVDVERLGVLVGTGVGGLATLEEQCRNFFEGGERAVSPHFVPMMMPNAAAGVIAMRLGAHGPGFSVSSACATGGHAIGEALRHDHARRGRRRRRRRHRGGADRRLPGRLPAHGRAVARGRLAPVRRAPRRLRHGRGRRRDRASSARSTPRRAARRSTAASPATAPRTTRSTSRSPTPRAAARSAAMLATLADAGVDARRRRLPQRPRHRHAVQRQDRDGRDQVRLQRLEHAAAGLLDEVGDRPPARRGRRGRGDRVPRGGAPRRPAADAQLRGAPTPSATSTTSPRARARRRASRWRCRTRSGSAARTPAWRSPRRSAAPRPPV